MPDSGGKPRRLPRSTRSTAADDGAVTRIDAACRLAVAGKLAVRDLAAWVDAVGVTETEFRLLWLLERSAAKPLDQAALAEQLAVSTAQVSGVVERLSRGGNIEHAPCASDRRRHAWRITATGRSVVSDVVAVVHALSPDEPATVAAPSPRARRRTAREVA